MHITLERRKEKRFPLEKFENIFRQCDINLVARRSDCDAVIEDISMDGLRLKLTAENSAVQKGEPVFIRGCVFNDLIGFLSSADCTVIWADGCRCGLRFDTPLGMDRSAFTDMIHCGSAGTGIRFFS